MDDLTEFADDWYCDEGHHLRNNPDATRCFYCGALLPPVHDPCPVSRWRLGHAAVRPGDAPPPPPEPCVKPGGHRGPHVTERGVMFR